MCIMYPKVQKSENYRMVEIYTYLLATLVAAKYEQWK